jgi:UDP-N-acetylmuramyl tripeptide synthase
MTALTPRLRSELAVALSRLAGWTSRMLLRREGRTISGHVYLRIGRRGRRGLIPASAPVVLVSGTNGKTTTTALIARAWATVTEVATNESGANLATGVYGALVSQRHRPAAVLEVDELALPGILTDLRPSVVALLNLSRDQMDRMHEVRRTASTWRTALSAFDGTVVANADDPLVVWAARGVARVAWVAAGQPWTVDATACPNCTSFVTFGAGGWACESCDLRRPATVDVGAIPALALPGRCNEANAAIALAVLADLGVPRETTSAWQALRSVAGRYEAVEVDGREVRLLLAKNPAGWQETLDLIDPASSLVLALNARTEDGVDPSWIWDVPFERLGRRPAVCAGERAADLAVRVDYAGLEVDVEEDLVAAVRRCAPGGVDLVGNYSAFREARSRMARHA